MGKFLRRYWGYIVLALAIAGLVVNAFGYAVIAVLSALALVYFLFQAPLTCGAKTRNKEPCRNNPHGLLLGCWIRQHKWQRTRDAFVSPKWQDTIRDLTASPKDALGTVGGLASIVSLIIAVILM